MGLVANHHDIAASISFFLLLLNVVKSRVLSSLFVAAIAVVISCGGSGSGGAEAYDLPYNVAYPKSMTLRAAVMTNKIPLAYTKIVPTTSSTEEELATTSSSSLNHYQGFQPDLLRHIQRIAQQKDNVTLKFQLEEAPPFSYTAQFEYVANDCNRTNSLTIEECNQYDLIVGDYYSYPSRSMRTLLSPPILRTAAATLQYMDRKRRIVSTLEEALVLNETVCLLEESFYDQRTLERYPGIQVTWCTTHAGCVQLLKEDSCALFVEDELQLRHLMVQDASLQITQERWREQYIVWPLNARLQPIQQQLLVRWIYEAKVEGILDDLYDRYFRVTFCPLGKAGKHCQSNCSASKGLADRHGTCVCESTRWTGQDCSVEVLENQNLLPTSVEIVCYSMIAINFGLVLGCAIWVYWHHKTVQVQVAQPLFLVLVLIGCLISTSTIFALLAQDDDQETFCGGLFKACMAMPWLYSVGFSITFGTLFAKIRRVYLIFRAAAQMQRLTISIKETVLTIGAILAVDVAVLTIWTIVDPLVWQRRVLVVDKFDSPLSSIGYCSSEHWLPFVGVIAMLHFLVLVFACYLCYASRHIPTEFSESKSVSLAMFSNLQIYLIGLPVLAMLGSESETNIFVRSAIVFINDFVVVTVIFGNLLYQVHWNPNRCRMSDNHADFLREAMHSYIANNTRAGAVARRMDDSNSTEGDGRAKPDEEEDEADNVLGEMPINDGSRNFSTYAPSPNAESDAEGGSGAFVQPSVLMAVSESEPRLHVSVGNGHNATIPITQINFDGDKPECILPKL